MTIVLTPVEARVLGSLVEKEITTPEYYPLSLNALANACNQKNNREPVTSLDEDQIRQALHGLEDDGLAGPARGTESRVTKYEHRMQEVFNFTRGEIAVVCVLLLRGPQTPGELRSRTERIFGFEDAEAVLTGLEKLRTREPALVRQLARQPGSRETRWIQLLGGSGDGESLQAGSAQTSDREYSAAVTNPEFDFRLEALEHELAKLRERIEALELKGGPTS
jgi:hypothetical protein